MSCTPSLFVSTNSSQLQIVRSIIDSAWSVAGTDEPLTNRLRTLEDLTYLESVPFGNCANICGSARVVKVQGLDSHVVFGSPVVQFVTCGPTPVVTIAYLLEATVPVRAQVQARLSGLGQTWPQSNFPLESQSPEVTVSIRTQGTALVVVPWIQGGSSQRFDWRHVSVSANLWVTPVTPDALPNWPEELKPFGDAMLTETFRMFQKDLTDAVRTQLSARISRKLRKALVTQLPVTMACGSVLQTKMSCTADTVSAPSACHPCDTCCRCMQQQVCSDECSACPCVKCGPVRPTVYVLWALAVALYAFLLFRTLFKHANKFAVK